MLSCARTGDLAAGGKPRVRDLFDRLVRYRNRELGHSAAGLRSTAVYHCIGRSLFIGVPEVFQCLDVLAGRWLIYIADVRWQADASWLVEQLG
jgi:hypothetical protein